jgi:hypothetical protein
MSGQRGQASVNVCCVIGGYEQTLLILLVSAFSATAALRIVICCKNFRLVCLPVS